MSTLTFRPEHYDEIVAGTKTSTVRWNEDIAPGPVDIVFEGRPDLGTLPAEVVRVDTYSATTLTPAQAHQPAGTDMAAFIQELRENHYPRLPEGTVLDVVVFELVQDPEADEA